MTALSSEFIFVIHRVNLMSINIRPAQFSDVDEIFSVRTSVTENHLSREEMRRMGITESVVAI